MDREQAADVESLSRVTSRLTGVSSTSRHQVDSIAHDDSSHADDDNVDDCLVTYDNASGCSGHEGVGRSR